MIALRSLWRQLCPKTSRPSLGALSALSFYLNVHFSDWRKCDICVSVRPVNIMDSHTSGNKNKPFTVLVEGNIGSGKTTYLQYFTQYKDVTLLTEPVERWRNLDGWNLLVSAFPSNLCLFVVSHSLTDCRIWCTKTRQSGRCLSSRSSRWRCSRCTTRKCRLGSSWWSDLSSAPVTASSKICFDPRLCIRLWDPSWTNGLSTRWRQSTFRLIS